MLIRNELGHFVKGSIPPSEWSSVTRLRAKKMRENRPEIICKICRKTFQVIPYRKDIAKTCSFKCGRKFTAQILKDKPKKQTLSSQGYFFIKKWGHYRANCNGYVKVADLVLEKKIGRKLKKGEIAHHVNGNRKDDSPENLELMYKKEHDRLHTIERHKTQKIFGKN